MKVNSAKKLLENVKGCEAVRVSLSVPNDASNEEIEQFMESVTKAGFRYIYQKSVFGREITVVDEVWDENSGSPRD